MPLPAATKAEVIKKLEEYEGRVAHLYLDSVGRVTVGVGHLVSNRSAASALAMYKTDKGLPTQQATAQEKQTDYDNVAKQVKGYKAAWYERHTQLVMKDADIDALRDKHVGDFYRELCNIYRKNAGAATDFDQMPRNAQLALFDMIFNLGAVKLAGVFTGFTQSVKAGDWKKAAGQCHRLGIAETRNEYVKNLLLAAAQPPAAK